MLQTRAWTLLRWFAFLVLAAALYSLAVWVLWRPVLEPVLWHGASLQWTIKDWYLGDQLTYMIIAGNVQNGDSAYVEPLTYTGSSIYPSAYYWLLGLFARVTGTNAFFAWNVIGMLCTVLLAVVCGAWGKWATSSNRGWLLGPLPLLIGTLVWWHNDHAWRVMYGRQATLWPPFAVLFNPAAEVAGIALGLFGLFAAMRAVCTQVMSWRWMAIAGACVGIGLNTHTYSTLFPIAAISAALLVRQLLVSTTRKELFISFACVLATWIFTISGATSSGLMHFGLLIAGMLAPLLIISDWRRNTWRALFMFGAAAVITSLPILIRDVMDVLSEDSFLKWRESVGQNDSVSLPLAQTIAYTSPTLLLAIAAFGSLLRRKDLRSMAWAAAIVGAFYAGLVMTFNAAWGMNQEPYRFYPQAALYLAAIGLPWLLTSVRGWLTVVLRLIVVAALLATAPTTWQFAKNTSRLAMNVSPSERNAYKNIAASAPDQGLVLTDLCIPRKGFRIISGKPTVDLTTGLALPEKSAPIQRVISEQLAGALPSSDALRDANVTSFLTMNYCRAIEPAVLEARFGKPIATATPVNADACGMPRDTTYALYATTNDASKAATPIPNYDIKAPNAFRTVAEGKPAPKPGANCSYALQY